MLLCISVQHSYLNMKIGAICKSHDLKNRFQEISDLKEIQIRKSECKKKIYFPV